MLLAVLSVQRWCCLLCVGMHLEHFRIFSRMILQQVDLSGGWLKLGDSKQDNIDMSMTQQEYSQFCMCQRTKERIIMCKPITNIQGKTPDELLKMSGQANTFPIDLEKLLETLSITCEPLDFEATVGGDKEILGALVTNGNKAAIFYRQQDAKDSHRCRFTIAHEIAHACLSNTVLSGSSVHYRREGDVVNAEEKAANIFAGELLVPEKMLSVVIGKLLFPTVRSLSKIFDVSERVIRARLDYLEINIDSNGVLVQT